MAVHLASLEIFKAGGVGGLEELSCGLSEATVKAAAKRNSSYGITQSNHKERVARHGAHGEEESCSIILVKTGLLLINDRSNKNGSRSLL